MPGKINAPLHEKTRTWYSLPVAITGTGDHLHRVAVPGLTVPHFGLIYFFARWGLPTEERLALTDRHELGHLQTFPVTLAHLLFILWPRRGRRKGSRWLRILVGFVAHQTAWELAAEGYVAFHFRRDRRHPRSATGRAIYAILWSGVAFLAAAGTVFLVQREAPPK